jgi:hypothetical protein
VQDNKLIPLTGLWENTSKNGVRYFSGVLGRAKVLLLPNKEKQAENDPDFILYMAERPPKAQEAGDRRLTSKPKPEAGDHGGLAGGDYPARRRGAF